MYLFFKIKVIATYLVGSYCYPGVATHNKKNPQKTTTLK